MPDDLFTIAVAHLITFYAGRFKTNEESSASARSNDAADASFTPVQVYANYGMILLSWNSKFRSNTL